MQHCLFACLTFRVQTELHDFQDISHAELFDRNRIMNRGAGVKASAMARTQEAWMLEAQIVGSLFNLRCNLQQVKTADDPGNPVVAACILRANYLKTSYLGVLKRRPP